MKIISNYHTHNELCRHATGTIEDYVLRAIELGYSEIGMSDHGPLPEDLKETLNSRRMFMNEYYDIYLPELDRLIEKYSGQIKILKSLEIEYLHAIIPNIKEFYKNADYLILGQHYFEYKDQYLSVYAISTPEILEAYVDSLIEAMSTGYFKILAHPEVFLWNYKVWDDECVVQCRRIIEACIKYNVIIEMNANGIRNSKYRNKFTTYLNPVTKVEEVDYSYPNKQFFKLVKEYDLEIVINDDAHRPENICDEATLETYELAKSLDLKVIKTIKF